MDGPSRQDTPGCRYHPRLGEKNAKYIIALEMENDIYPTMNEDHRQRQNNTCLNLLP